MCAGYYNYDQGYTPDFPGMGDFKGQIVHPQHWPEKLDYQGKKIGNSMLEFCFQESVKLNAKKLILFSNTLLQPAIHLYKKYGFVEVPIGNVAYKRANIKMEKFLS
jgi:hypothetical protein